MFKSIDISREILEAEKILIIYRSYIFIGRFRSVMECVHIFPICVVDFGAIFNEKNGTGHVPFETRAVQSCHSARIGILEKFDTKETIETAKR